MPTTSVPMSAFQVNDYLNSIPNTPQGLNLLSQYVNNSNPQIPSWQALVRLNNIKQQEQAYKEFQAPTQQPTVKDQIQQSLSQQVNPAQPQQMQQMPQQAQQPAMMAAGGIASVPTANMFNAGSYAGGGIVAFVDNEDQPVSEDMPNNSSPRYISGRDPYNTEGSVEEEVLGSSTDKAAPVVRPAPIAAPRPVAALATPAGAVIDKPQNRTTDELIAEQQDLQRRFGVSDNPYADAKARMAKTDARNEAKYSQDPTDRLIAQLSGFATADPTKRVWLCHGWRS